jgi:hypothetical protein
LGYLISAIIIFLALRCITKRRIFSELTAILMVLGIWFALTTKPVSTATQDAIKTSTGVWIDRSASKQLSGIKQASKEFDIAYGENHFSKDCYQKIGEQLLGFSKITRVWTYRDIFGGCTASTRNPKKVYFAKKIFSGTQCPELLKTAFENHEQAKACIDSTDDADSFERWHILLNCAQSIREYQLRWTQPNMLTGGGDLETFAGVNFKSGNCLDLSHKKMIGDLLDVIGKS